jgi:hypothetical protein
LKAWPTLLGFASDQDLALLADAGATVAGPGAIWGVEQAEDRTRADFGKFLAYDRRTLLDLKRLSTIWTPPSGTRARLLLDGLVKSAEIYDDYVRGKAEHDLRLVI